MRTDDATILRCMLPMSASVGQNVVVSVRPESIILSSEARSDDDQPINRLRERLPSRPLAAHLTVIRFRQVSAS